MKKITILLVLGLCLVGIVSFSFKGHLFTESYARKIAMERVKEYCDRNSISTDKLEGPVALGKSLKYPFHFSWSYIKNGKNYIVGTWIDYGGSVDLYSGPK